MFFNYVIFQIYQYFKIYQLEQNSSKLQYNQQKNIPMKGMLSPTSRTNCPNMYPSSPSSKSFSSMSLEDSFSSLGCSQLINSQPIYGRKLSFKKIKEQKIKQKNEKSKIIKQFVYKNRQNMQRLKTLDEVKTIQSRNSPRSSVSTCKKRIQESIIIMSGKDLDKRAKAQQEDYMNLDLPQTPSFKRRNTYNQENKNKLDFLKRISSNPDLVRSIQSGMIFHFEITKKPVQFYQRVLNVKNQGLLQIYSTIPLKSCFCSLTLLIYQPYTQTLSEKLLKIESISFAQLLGYMVEIIKILSFLKNMCIYPQIQPTTVVISNSSIKLKIRYEQEPSSERQVIRQCGYYFSSLLKSLITYNIIPSSKKVRKISGLTIQKRLKFQNLMDEFIRFQQYSLDQAYLKLEIFDY